MGVGETKNALSRLTVAVLRKRCEEAGLDASGLKADLVERLFANADQEASPDAANQPKDVVDGEEDDAAEEPVVVDADADADESPQVISASGDDDALVVHLRDNPADSAGWEHLARLAQQGSIPAVRPLFEELVQSFPRSSLAWCWYVDAELTRNSDGAPDDEAIRELFGRCLIPCPSALLWRKYASYMASTNDTTTAEGVETMKSVYEYSVDMVGEDADAGELWLDYCQFLRNTEATLIATDVAAEQAPSARDMIVRRTYQRALSVPMHKLDVVYKAYETFEQEKNKTLARALLQELAPKLLLTRTALGKRKKILEGVTVGAVCVDPVQRGADGSGSWVCSSFNKASCRGCSALHVCNYCGATTHGAQGCSRSTYSLLASSQKVCTDQWTAVIEFEKSNVQKLEGATPNEPSPQLFARVKHAYDLAGLSLGETPEYWLEYAHWHESEGRPDDAAEVLQRAREALPHCSLLTFAAADLEESRGDGEACKKIYEDVLDAYESNASEAAERGEQSDMPADIRLLYCEYIRTCRRVEDQSSSRKAFMRARKAPGCTWELYASAAMVEWQYDKSDKPARNIFELGLKSFLNEPRYVEQYAEFLIGINDVANARVLFERALNESPTTKIWDMFVDFERAHGTVDTISDAESRRNAACGSTSVKINLLNSLLGRHTLMDLRPASDAYCDYFSSLGAVVPMMRSEAGGISYASIRAQRLAQQAALASVPPPSAPSGAPGRTARAPPPAPPADKRKLPGMLGKFFASLPGPVAFAKFPPPRVDAVLNALKKTDLSEEAIEGYLNDLGYSGGEKRKAIELIEDPALAASRASAASKPPAKDVFRSRQSKMQRAQAEYQ